MCRTKRAVRKQRQFTPPSGDFRNSITQQSPPLNGRVMCPHSGVPFTRVVGRMKRVGGSWRQLQLDCINAGDHKQATSSAGFIGEGVSAFICTCVFQREKVWTNFRHPFRRCASGKPIGHIPVFKGAFLFRPSRHLSFQRPRDRRRPCWWASRARRYWSSDPRWSAKPDWPGRWPFGPNRAVGRHSNSVRDSGPDWQWPG